MSPGMPLPTPQPLRNPLLTGSVDPGQGTQPEPDGGLPGDVLYRYYMSWETGKTGERQDMGKSWRYYNHKHWTSEQLAVLNARKQLPTVWNRIKRKVDFLVGTQQRLRRDPKGYARTPVHEQAADIASAVLRYMDDASKWKAEASMCVRDYFVAGIGVSYNSIEDGEPVKRWVPVEKFFYDPRSINPFFRDVKYLGLVQWVDLDAAKQIIGAVGGNVAQLETLVGSQADTVSDWNTNKEWVIANANERRLRLVEMWYLHEGRWRCAYLCGTEKLADVPSPYVRGKSTGHPYNPVSCYIDEKGDRYGLVIGMIPVQDEINFVHSKLTWLLAARQVLVEEGAVKDIDAVRRQLMRADGVISLTPGAMAANKFQIQKHEAEISGWTGMLQAALAEIENLGPNPGLIGRGDGINTQSGRAILAQQNAGMTELSPVFEQIREWQLEGYKVDWLNARQFWTGEKWIRVTDDDASQQFVALNRVIQNPLTGAIIVENRVAELDLDIIVEEGPDTITMKEEMMQTFGQIGQAAIGPLGKVLIELSGMPNKDKLLKMMDEVQQPPPAVIEMQKRMDDLEALLKQMNILKASAEVESKRADALAKLAGAGVPPHALPAFFPVPFADDPRVGGGAPQPEMMPPGMMPDQPSFDPGMMSDPMSAMMMGGSPAPQLPAPAMADPMMITEPQLGGPGGLPMAPPGVLPSSPAPAF